MTNVMTVASVEASPSNHCIAIPLIIQLSIQTGNTKLINFGSTESTVTDLPISLLTEMLKILLRLKIFKMKNMM